ncbi:MAG: phosphate ABC transporter permease PstA [Dehalococcoidia bacterium]|nr:phosphate ABC transporter permease PstA [Dehalococcoidia bacterium]
MSISRQERNLAGRRRGDRIFGFVGLGATVLGLLVLVVLIVDVAKDGLPNLNWEFITSFPSRRPGQAGILSALVGSIYMLSLVALIALPLGVGAAIFLEEYEKRGWLASLIQINIQNLAGVPSVVYGLLGLGLFVRLLGFERSLLSGALTMALLVLPIVIIAAQEAIKAVPPSLREAAYALGATKWQMIWHVVLPSAFPGILTGVILALSRAIGESAPLITIGALTFIAFLPDGPFSPFTVLPIQIFNWVSRPQAGFHDRAAAGILLLLAVLLSMNAIAVYLRNKLQRKW